MSIGFANVFGTLPRIGRRVRRALGRAGLADEMAAVNAALAGQGLPPSDGTDGDAAAAERMYELRDDVRAAIPLATTPAGRMAFVNWFLTSGRHQSGAAVADILAFLRRQDATPDRGLATAYLWNPAWQARHPLALTPGGWGEFKAWVGAEYGVRGWWLRRAALPPRFDKSPGNGLGANVLGMFRYTSGLQQNAVAVVDALTAAGVGTSLRDIPKPFDRGDRRPEPFDGLERFPVTVIDTGLDVPVPEAYRIAGLHPRPGVYRVAVWSWELEQLPADCLDRGADVDEIWAPTTFIADAMRPYGKPVYTILTPVQLAPFTPRSKEYFGLDPAKFTFLFAFDMNSRLARKNPLALIRAFRLAFRPGEPVELALKVSPQERFFADWWAELRGAAAAGGVKLIDRSLPRGEVLALMNAADAYVSLHRSEGVGLTMAEAMLLGKPTIATAYSGNLDFMTPDDSFLVDYEPTTIAEDIPPYPKGFVWAEPSVEHAAELMRRVVDQPDETRRVAARGQASARRLFDPLAAGRKMAARLAAIRDGGRS